MRDKEKDFDNIDVKSCGHGPKYAIGDESSGRHHDTNNDSRIRNSSRGKDLLAANKQLPEGDFNDRGRRGRNTDNRSRHKNAWIRYCDQCPFTTVYGCDMRRHRLRHSTCTFPCKECNMPFSSMGHLRGHCRTAHGQECTGYDVKSELCPKQGWKQCDICEYATRNIGDLKKHKRCHKFGIVQCEVCRRSYNNMTAYKFHLWKDHNIEESRSGRSYVSEDSIHVLSHERQYDLDRKAAGTADNRRLSKRKKYDEHMESSTRKAHAKLCELDKNTLNSKTKRGDTAPKKHQKRPQGNLLTTEENTNAEGPDDNHAIECIFCDFVAHSYKSLKGHLDGHDFEMSTDNKKGYDSWSRNDDMVVYGTEKSAESIAPDHPDSVITESERLDSDSYNETNASDDQGIDIHAAKEGHIVLEETDETFTTVVDLNTTFIRSNSSRHGCMISEKTCKERHDDNNKTDLRERANNGQSKIEISSKDSNGPERNKMIYDNSDNTRVFNEVINDQTLEGKDIVTQTMHQKPYGVLCEFKTGASAILEKQVNSSSEEGCYRGCRQSLESNRLISDDPRKHTVFEVATQTCPTESKAVQTNDDAQGKDGNSRKYKQYRFRDKCGLHKLSGDTSTMENGSTKQTRKHGEHTGIVLTGRLNRKDFKRNRKFYAEVPVDSRGTVLYECLICDSDNMFGSGQSAAKHFLSHHQTLRQIVCDTCPYCSSPFPHDP